MPYSQLFVVVRFLIVGPELRREFPVVTSDEVPYDEAKALAQKRERETRLWGITCYEYRPVRAEEVPELLKGVGEE